MNSGSSLVQMHSTNDTYTNDTYTNDTYTNDTYTNDTYTNDAYTNDNYTTILLKLNSNFGRSSTLCADFLPSITTSLSSDVIRPNW